MSYIRPFLFLLLTIPKILAAQDFQVGEVTLNLIDSARNRPVKTELWYPTTETDSGNKRMTALPFVLEPTIRDALVANQRFPVVLLSHGTGGNRFSQAWLAIALARQGYVVAAPDHWGNTFDNAIPEMGDLRKRIDELTCEHFDLKDGRIKAFVALAPALGLGVNASEQTKKVTAPVLIIGAENDQIAPVLTNAKNYHSYLPASEYKELAGETGHYVFLNAGDVSLKKEAKKYYIDDASVNREQIHEDVEKMTIDFFDVHLKYTRTAGTRPWGGMKFSYI